MATSFGKERAGSRILRITQKALVEAKSSNTVGISNDGEFWLTSLQSKDPPVRNRSNESGSVVKAEYLPPIELKAVLAIAASDNVGASQEEVIRAAAAMMGFKRVGQDLQAAFEAQIGESSSELTAD